MASSFFSTYLNEHFLNVDDAHSIAVLEQPFLKLLKFVKQGGRATHQRFTLTGSRAFSGSFTATMAMADNGSASSRNFEWEVPVGEFFGAIRVEHKDIALSETSEDAASRAAQHQMELGIAEFAQGLVRKLFGSGGARIGTALFDEQATNGCPTFSLQFTDASVVKNIQIGDHVVITASTDDGTESGDTQIGSAGYVLEKDDEIGYARVATTSAIDTPANPGSWVDGTTYSVYRAGELDAGDLTSQITSYGAYITSTKATTTLCGVNRNLHGALSGVRLPSTDPANNGTIVAKLKKHLAVMANRAGQRHGAVVVTNPEDFDTIGGELEAQGFRNPGKTTEVGYMGVTINSALGATDVVSEPSQPKGEYLILDPKELELHTANGKLYQAVEVNGSAFHLLEGSNTLEARPVCYNKNFIGHPWHHGRGTV